MRDVIYLTMTPSGVQTMRKSYAGARRGEAIVKLNVEVPAEAFNPPMLEQQVTINDWREGIDIEDVQFNKSIITEEEAEIIRQKRLAKMAQILQEQGYQVTKTEETE